MPYKVAFELSNYVRAIVLRKKNLNYFLLTLLYVRLLKPFIWKALETTPQWTLPKHNMSQIAKGRHHHNELLTASFLSKESIS